MDSELNLGVKPKKYDEPKDVAPEEKLTYPALRFSDEHAKLFKDKFGQCGIDDEYEITMKLKVSGISDQQYDKSISFDVLAIKGDVVEEEAADDDSEKEEAEEKPTQKDSKKSKPAVVGKLKY